MYNLYIYLNYNLHKYISNLKYNYFILVLLYHWIYIYIYIYTHTVYLYKGCSVQLLSREKITHDLPPKVWEEERVEGRMRHSTDTAVKHIKQWKNDRMKKQTHRVAVYHSYCTHITFTGERGRLQSGIMGNNQLHWKYWSDCVEQWCYQEECEDAEDRYIQLAAETYKEMSRLYISRNNIFYIYFFIINKKNIYILNQK